MIRRKRKPKKKSLRKSSPSFGGVGEAIYFFLNKGTAEQASPNIIFLATSCNLLVKSTNTDSGIG
jgi:hypothetical protein